MEQKNANELSIREMIHIFENSRLTSEHFETSGLCAAYVGALEALHRVMPKKPPKSDSGNFNICPNCNRFVERFEPAHGLNEILCCKWCGQALDWRTDER